MSQFGRIGAQVSVNKPDLLLLNLYVKSSGVEVQIIVKASTPLNLTLTPPNSLTYNYVYY